MTITIKEVAEKAGVSPATVSRVFNEKRGIASSTKKLVRNAADELGYTPRKYVKKSVSKKLKNVYIVFNKQFNSLSNNSFYNEIIKGVEESLNEYGYQLVFNTITEDEDDFKKMLEIKNNSEVKGFVLTGYEIPVKLILDCKKDKFPVVLVDNIIKEQNV